MSDLFAGRFVLVTGASSGIGEEFARQLAARRANLILTARSAGKLESLARLLSEQDQIRAEVITEDLGAPGGAARLCDALAARGLTVDHLISNAGFGTNGAIVDADADRQGEMVRLNCEALTVLSTRLLPQMVARGSGGIIHVASVAGMQPVPYMATYGATKAFVLSFSEALSEEVRGTGVRVMALCPGPVPTGFQAVAGSGIAPSQRSAVLTADEVVERAIRDYERGKTVSVPGALNRIQSVATRMVPNGLLVPVVAKMMKQKKSASPS